MEQTVWNQLKEFTNARIALEKAGNSLATKEIFKFKIAHSIAKDAINAVLDIDMLSDKIKQLGFEFIKVKSSVNNRLEYLKNPNKGRILDFESIENLKALNPKDNDLCIILADGLSANAINLHAIPFLKELIPLLTNWNIAPIVFSENSRVALSDQIGELLKSKICLILIGERPGLSSPHSMGAYITYHPQMNNTDEKRNCISNIHPEGLSFIFAAQKLSYLLSQILIKQISGVQLKDDFNNQLEI